MGHRGDNKAPPEVLKMLHLTLLFLSLLTRLKENGVECSEQVNSASCTVCPLPQSCFHRLKQRQRH